MTASLQDALAAVRAGETGRAQLLTAEVIRDNPDDANAWYLLSQLVDSDARRAIYLRKVLALDPHHSRAQAEFGALPAATVASLGGALAGDAEPAGAVAYAVPDAVAEREAAPSVGESVEALDEGEITPTQAAPVLPQPATPAPVAVVAPAVTAPPTPAPAPAQPRRTPPQPPPARRGNGALAALLVILVLLTLAVLAVLAYLLLFQP